MKLPFASLLLALLGLFATTSLRADLVAYWPFDDVANFATDPASGNALTVEGGAGHTTDGKFGGGLALDNDGDFLSGSIDRLPIGDSPYTIAVWFKTDKPSAGIIGWGNYGTNRQVNALRTNGNFILNYWWSADLAGDASPANILDGQWHHAAATYDGTTRRIYVNGEEKASDNPNTHEATAANFRIGSTNSGEYFDGTLDEVLIYDHALTAAEIMAISSGTSARYAIVTNNTDSGAGSLRQAIIDSDANTAITFDPSLSGEIITLSGTQLTLDKSLTIDASNLSGGLTIDASGGSRVMRIQPGTTVALQNLTLTGGAPTDGNSGGAIYNDHANLSLSRCTIFNNFAYSGAGILNEGIDGGATLSLSTCTLTGNSAAFNGGGIFNNGTLNLNACTVSGNSADIAGGGVFSFGFGVSEGVHGTAPASLHDTILAGNIAPDSADLGEFHPGATTTATGTNLLSSTDGYDTISGTGLVTIGDPMLTPLGDYCGPTQTMHPLPGSDAFRAGISTRIDQRGLTVTGPLTIGAVQVGAMRNVNDTNDGGIGIGSLRAALGASVATAGTFVWFDQSLNGATIDLNSSPLEIAGSAKGLTIYASDLANGLTIDANGSEATPRRVMTISPGATAALHGLTLTGGVASGSGQGNYGGAIYNDHATLSLSACTLSGNSAAILGGGIYSDGKDSGNATLSLSGCTLTGNHAGDTGGGICSNGETGSATLNMSGCTLSGNSANFLGGGIYINGRNSGSATLSMSACTVSGNSGNFGGGGIFSSGENRGSATLSLSACTLSGNSTTQSKGGGIFTNGDYMGSVTLSLSACTLSGNSATGQFGRGGAIFTSGFEGSVTLSLSACTLSGNYAGKDGGGIYSDGEDGSATLNLDDSILAGNTAPTAPDLRAVGNVTPITTGTNLIGDVGNSGIATVWRLIGNSAAPIKPMLTPLGDYGGPTQTMPPPPRSPAIDRNTSRLLDQRGFTISGNSGDIGAAEYQGDADFRSNIVPAIWDIDHDGDGNTFGVEFALGTDPSVSDASDPANLRLQFNTDSQPVLEFGYNADAWRYVDWILERSYDLSTNSWQRVASELIGFESSERFEFVDDTASTQGAAQAFYRFRAVPFDPGPQ